MRESLKQQATTEPKKPEIISDEQLVKIEKRFFRIKALWQLAEARNIQVKDSLHLKQLKKTLFMSRDKHTCVGNRCPWFSAGQETDGSDMVIVDPYEVGHPRRRYRATGRVFICGLSGFAHVCRHESASCSHFSLNRNSELICSVSGLSLGVQYCSSTPYGRSFVSDGSNNVRGGGGGDDGGGGGDAGGGGGGEDGDELDAIVGGGDPLALDDSLPLPPPTTNVAKKPPRGSKAVVAAPRKRFRKSERVIRPSQEKEFRSLEEFQDAFFSGQLKTQADSTLLAPEYGRSMIDITMKSFSETSKNFAERLARNLMFHPMIGKLLNERHEDADQQASAQADRYCSAMIGQGCAPRREMIIYIYYSFQRRLLNQTLQRVSTDRRNEYFYVGYFKEAMLKTWAIISSTPHSKERTRAVLSRLALAIMYKLRDGLRMDITYDAESKRAVLRTKMEPGRQYMTEAIEFIPAHEILYCMPEANEIKLLQLQELRSPSVMKSQRKLNDYYSSLIIKGLHIDQVRQFSLRHYMAIRPDIGCNI